MADPKSRFTRPDRPTAPAPGPQADQFVHGTTSPPQEARGADSEAGPMPAVANQASKAVAKPEPMKRLTIDIPEGLHKRVKSQCADQGTTIADVVRIFLEKKFPATKRL